MLRFVLIKLFRLLIVMLLLIKSIHKERVEPLNYSQFHITDVVDIKDERNYVITLYNDMESVNMYEFYVRIWNTITDTRIYKTKLHIKMKIIISDRGNCKQIICHEAIDLTDICDFDDYWNTVKDISKDLEHYYKP